MGTVRQTWHMAPVTTSTLPDDIPAAIRAVKAELRARLGDVAGALADVEAGMRAEVGAIVAARAAGGGVWPVVAFADVAAATVPAATVAAIRRRGCAVVRGTFPRAQAEAWDRELAAYVDVNDFDAKFRRVDEEIFGGLKHGRPSIFPIYWSRPQVQARQHPNMAAVQSFLNRFWAFESHGRRWFDPDRDSAYPDRVRRRPPAEAARGLSPHADSGKIERWLLPAYQQVYRAVFDGDWREYDPWDAAHRTEVHEYPAKVMCSAFRTFQGWTALNDVEPSDGVLHVVPIPAAMAYMLLRPLADDVPDDELCGATASRSIAAVPEYHEVLLPALTPIPAVAPGDTVWWHGDIIHSVEPAANVERWNNVMYIPVAPWCEKNAAYARACLDSFERGASPFDFPEEHYETDWTNRATVGDLSEIGRAQFGLR